MTTFRYGGEMGENGRRLHTHCKRGHPLTPENSYYKPDGQRNCKTCRAMRNAGRVRVRQGVVDIPRIDGSPWLDLLAATVRRALTDYATGEGDDYETALEFLCHAGLVRRDGSIRRPS